jgi:hypothetical protein
LYVPAITECNHPAATGPGRSPAAIILVSKGVDLGLVVTEEPGYVGQTVESIALGDWSNTLAAAGDDSAQN